MSRIKATAGAYQIPQRRVTSRYCIYRVIIKISYYKEKVRTWQNNTDFGLDGGMVLSATEPFATAPQGQLRR